MKTSKTGPRLKKPGGEGLLTDFLQRVVVDFDDVIQKMNSIPGSLRQQGPVDIQAVFRLFY